MMTRPKKTLCSLLTCVLFSAASTHCVTPQTIISPEGVSSIAQPVPLASEARPVPEDHHSSGIKISYEWSYFQELFSDPSVNIHYGQKIRQKKVGFGISLGDITVYQDRADKEHPQYCIVSRSYSPLKKGVLAEMSKHFSEISDAYAVSRSDMEGLSRYIHESTTDVTAFRVDLCYKADDPQGILKVYEHSNDNTGRMLGSRNISLFLGLSILHYTDRSIFGCSMDGTVVSGEYSSVQKSGRIVFERK